MIESFSVIAIFGVFIKKKSDHYERKPAIFFLHYILIYGHIIQSYQDLMIIFCQEFILPICHITLANICQKWWEQYFEIFNSAKQVENTLYTNKNNISLFQDLWVWMKLRAFYICFFSHHLGIHWIMTHLLK